MFVSQNCSTLVGQDYSTDLDNQHMSVNLRSASQPI